MLESIIRKWKGNAVLAATALTLSLGNISCGQDFDDCETNSCCKEAYSDCTDGCYSNKDSFYRGMCIDLCGTDMSKCVERVTGSPSSSNPPSGGGYSSSVPDCIPCGREEGGRVYLEHERCPSDMICSSVMTTDGIGMVICFPRGTETYQCK